MKRGPEESNGPAVKKSTMEKLQLLVKEMQVANNLQTLHKFINMISYKVEEREFAQGMEGRNRRAEELKKMIAEKEERLRKAKDEVVPIYTFQHSFYSPLIEQVEKMDALLWDKEEAVQILWEMYRYLKPLKYYQNIILTPTLFPLTCIAL